MTKKTPPKKNRFHIPESIKTFGTIALLVILGFYVAAQFIQPAPPDSFKLAIGAKGGAYHESAMKYVDFLKKHRVDIEFLETAGALENMRLLNKGEVDAALLQSGLAGLTPVENIQALGAIYYEPLWVFLRPDLQVTRLYELKGKKLSIGAKGSGTRAVSKQILFANGIDETDLSFYAHDKDEAFNLLKSGQIDAVFMVGGYEAKTIQKFLNESEISLMNFERPATYAKKYPFLAHISLPEGLVDLERNLPPSETHLISPSAVLAVNKDFYGALKSLLIHMASETHNIAGPFNNLGEFPTPKHVDLTVSEEAQRYFEHGPSLLQRYLPFWMADILDRLKIMLIPLIGLLLPLMKIAPPTYRWRIRKKIYRWYKDLKSVEEKGLSETNSKKLAELMNELDRIDEEAKLTPVPLAYTDELYDLRLHIKMVREYLKKVKKAA